MTNDDTVIALLRSIDQRLALLTMTEARELRAALKKDVLNTESRQKMFDAIDGVRGNPELAVIGDVTSRAAQNFVNQLIEMHLAKVVSTGREVIVERDGDGIVRWYLQATEAGRGRRDA